VYKAGDRELTWKPIEVRDGSGIVNISDPLGTGSECIGYGLARITVPAATDVVIKAGSDDGIKIWVNGEGVHENNVNRGTAIDQDEAPAKLQAGENTIL